MGQTTGRLHIGYLEVVAQVAVGVLVVVSIGKVTELLAKAFATGIVLAGLAIAVAAPISKTLCNVLEFAVVGEHRAAFAHGDVMSRVKAQCGNVPKGAHHLTTVGCDQRISAFFN